MKSFTVPGKVAPWKSGTWKLTAGLLDATAEYAFTHGQCHAMAVALNKLTGFEIVGLGGEISSNGPAHFMVRADFDYLLDAEGLHTIERATRRHGQLHEYNAASPYGQDGKAYAWELVSTGDYYPLHLHAAMHFASLVIDRYL